MASQSFQFVMRTGPSPGKVFEVSKSEIYIGRDINNDIAINDAEVSRKHARVILQSGEYVLEDLGSTNGTYVNGQRLMGPHVMRPGETILLGENVSLAFEAGYDADSTMLAAPEQTPAFTAPPPHQEAYIPPPQQAEPVTPIPTPSSEPVYSGQVPYGPAESYQAPAPPPTSAPAPRKINRTLLYAGCGCLVVLLCILVSAALAFDYLNLYCTPPFDALFACS
jgi:predicted component of type VI protein secretion system